MTQPARSYTVSPRSTSLRNESLETPDLSGKISSGILWASGLVILRYFIAKRRYASWLSWNTATSMSWGSAESRNDQKMTIRRTYGSRKRRSTSSFFNVPFGALSRGFSSESVARPGFDQRDRNVQRVSRITVRRPVSIAYSHPDSETPSRQSVSTSTNRGSSARQSASGRPSSFRTMLPPRTMAAIL